MLRIAFFTLNDTFFFSFLFITTFMFVCFANVYSFLYVIPNHNVILAFANPSWSSLQTRNSCNLILWSQVNTVSYLNLLKHVRPNQNSYLFVIIYRCVQIQTKLLCLKCPAIPDFPPTTAVGAHSAKYARLFVF